MPRLKKILFSMLVILVFAAYAIHQRQESTERIGPLQAATTPTSSSGTATNTTPAGSSVSYKDGAYTGSVEDAFYGNIQVKVIIGGGQLTDVIFLQHPSDRSTSVFINEQAMPLLKAEAIKAQSAHVDIVSGATDSSSAFIKSLQTALRNAQV